MRAAIICYATRQASAIGRYQIRSCRRSKQRGGHPCLQRALQRHAVPPTGRGSSMSQLVSVLFERELTRRGVSFSFDHESARYRIEHQGEKLWVSLDNLARAYNRDRDQSRIASFVDAVLGSRFESRPWTEAQPSILFALEPSDHVEPSDLRTPLSKQVDRVPVVSDASRGTITWITQAMLDHWNISLSELERTALHNLAAALAAAKVA